MSQSAQKVLSAGKGADGEVEDTLDPIKAIVIPLSTIKSVTKKFVDNANFAVECILLLQTELTMALCDENDFSLFQAAANFMIFLNEMYIETEALEKQVWVYHLCE